MNDQTIYEGLGEVADWRNCMTIFGNYFEQLRENNEIENIKLISCQILSERDREILKLTGTMNDTIMTGKDDLTITFFSCNEEDINLLLANPKKRTRSGSESDDDGMFEDYDQGRDYNLDHHLLISRNLFYPTKDWSGLIASNQGAKYGHRDNPRGPWTSEHRDAVCNFLEHKSNLTKDAFEVLRVTETTNQYNDLDKFNEDMKHHHFLLNVDYTATKVSKEFEVKDRTKNETKKITKFHVEIEFNKLFVYAQGVEII